MFTSISVFLYIFVLQSQTRMKQTDGLRSKTHNEAIRTAEEQWKQFENWL